MTQAFTAYSALVLSLGAHLSLIVRASSEREAPPALPPSFVEFSTIIPKPVPVPPAPEVEPPPPPPAKPVPKRQPRAAVEPVPAVEESPPPEPELSPTTATAELTGTTLASESATGWTAPLGNGAPRDGAIHAQAVRTGKAKVAPQAAAKVTPSVEVVSLGDLSRRPEPPPLQQILARYYPPAARSLRQSGEAQVRARIEANGSVRVANTTFETGEGFGSACRAALLNSKWSPPLV
jgi:outer membrane biosynthesis protein TonB